MDWSAMPHELRRAMRVRSKGSVRIRRGAASIHARVIDLGLGGMCVRAELPLSRISLVGEIVRIEVRLDAHLGRRFLLCGRVVRTSPVHKSIAIEFDIVPEDFEDRVQDELLAALEHDTAPRIVIVDGPGRRRAAFADAFRGAGCAVTEVSTALEAIVHLGGARFEPGMIAIVDSSPPRTAEELRDFVRGEHPDAHMVAIGKSAANRNEAESWLGSVCSTDLPSRVARVMTAHDTRRRATTSR